MVFRFDASFYYRTNTQWIICLGEIRKLNVRSIGFNLKESMILVPNKNINSLMLRSWFD